MFWTVRGVKPSGSKARTRSEADPKQLLRRAAHRFGRRLAGHQRGRDDGHAQRHPQHRETGAQRSAGQAPPGDRGETHALEAQLGQAHDQRPRLVVGAAAELDRLQDFAVAHHQHAIGVGGGPRVMGHQHDRLAQPIAGVPQQVQDLGAGREVQVPRRLIGQEDGRAGRQGAGQGDPLLLARGELVRPLPGLVGQAHQLQQLVHAFAAVAKASPRR